MLLTYRNTESCNISHFLSFFFFFFFFCIFLSFFFFFVFVFVLFLFFVNFVVVCLFVCLFVFFGSAQLLRMTLYLFILLSGQFCKAKCQAIYTTVVLLPIIHVYMTVPQAENPNPKPLS